MTEDLADTVVDWFAHAARDLPWRKRQAGPWAILVSEVMLQQTPVVRVQPVYQAWLRRWPTPAALAADSPGDAVRMWAKLGYPRRALRLHACAVAVVERFNGSVPADVDDLQSLPGVGAYTARAVATFAFGRRHPVVDTNVRRVLARAIGGQGAAGPPSTARDLAAAQVLLPADPSRAARFSAGLMELGAMVCTARTPRCAACPIALGCAWRLAGWPAYDGPSARPQRFVGTDRQVRGRLLDVVRASGRPVTRAALDAVWADAVQRDRALGTLIVDGLLDPLPDGRFALPGLISH
ncbi:MAG: A/G-specific adenine glycosylase [Jatrophihabitantaceae bacterium]